MARLHLPNLHQFHQSLSAPTLADRGRALAVRASLAGDDLHVRLRTGAEHRMSVLRDDGERGSQTAEYAMVGGVGAAAAGALITCIKNRDTVERVLDAVVKVLLKSIRTWF